MNSYPDIFWHCFVKLVGVQKYAIRNDMTFDQLKTEVLTPWKNSSTFTVSGKIISKDTKIEEIKITQTDEPQSVFEDRHNSRNRENGICDLATDRKMLPIWNGRDLTNELLFAEKKANFFDDDMTLIERVCKRISYAARILSNRQRKGKNSFEIKDEYDVQDLLHAVLRANLKYSVQEDPLPKVAGTKSSRADISIEELGILIEIKFVRSPDDQKVIFNAFSQDLVLYSAWPHLRKLLYVIYNANDLSDPEALEKLSGPKKISGKEFAVNVILV
ncbi:MAG: hypothetical protein MUO31_11035 [Thermodesulfovibrionales bacterium]|nr:hypothetical protein [Thermodesulfovibrionales bacterium]